MRSRALITVAACPNLPVKRAVYPVLLCSNNSRQMLRHRQRRPASCEDSLQWLQTQTRVTAWFWPEMSRMRFCLAWPRMLYKYHRPQVGLASKLLPAATRQLVPRNIPQQTHGEDRGGFAPQLQPDVLSTSQKLPIHVPSPCLRNVQEA